MCFLYSVKVKMNVTEYLLYKNLKNLESRTFFQYSNEVQILSLELLKLFKVTDEWLKKRQSLELDGSLFLHFLAVVQLAVL